MQKDGLAYWVAGLRECFEEVGILLHDASQIIDHQLKVNQRTELNNGNTNFLDICKAQKLNLPTDSMIPISHWITPEVEVKRFDTWFFLMHYQGDQQSNHDGIELTNSSWINPQEALDACSSGKMNMIIPTIKNLEKLVPFKRVEDATDFFKEKVSSIPSILPKFEKQDGHWNFVIPENSD